MLIKKLLPTEDHWAIAIGSFLLIVTFLLFWTNKPIEWEQIEINEAQLQAEENAPFKTIFWYESFDEQQSIKGSNTSLGKQLNFFSSKPGKWKSNPIEALYLSENKASENQEELINKINQARTKEEIAFKEARENENIANARMYKNRRLNEQAVASIAEWRSSKKEIDALVKKFKKKSKGFNKFYALILLMIMFLFLIGTGTKILGGSFKKLIPSFSIIFLLALLAFLLGGQSSMKTYGLGYAFWAILIGLVISNTVGTPEWLKHALKTEFFIKIGLVLLGAEVLIGKVLTIGLPGIFVAWVVTPIVLIVTFWFGQKVLKIGSKTLNMTICADMSVCGVSAAVATAAACKAKKEELTLAIGLSMVFTSIMMIVMPMFIKAIGMSEVLGGAWMGGTIDATGAVVAAGAFLGDKALNVAATIKMIQNILIGIVAFGVAVYFSKKEGGESSATWREIYNRFPKFILGFIGVSILFSVLYELLGNAKAYALIDQGVIANFSKNIRGWCFCLAFVSIGLSTEFKLFQPYFSKGKPFILYLCGQALNLLLTLLMAYIMFYLVFPEITEKI